MLQTSDTYCLFTVVKTLLVESIRWTHCQHGRNLQTRISRQCQGREGGRESLFQNFERQEQNGSNSSKDNADFSVKEGNIHFMMCSTHFIVLYLPTNTRLRITILGHRIDPSWWTHRAISCSSHCCTTGVTKAVVCVILSVG